MEARYIPITETAKIIRQVLKEAFPGGNFSVRKDHHTVRIAYTDGPSIPQVEEKVRFFESATFEQNGADTIRGASAVKKWKGEMVVFGSDYIAIERNYSMEMYQKVARAYCERYGYQFPLITESEYTGSPTIKDDYRVNDRDYISQAIEKVAEKTAEAQAEKPWGDLCKKCTFDPAMAGSDFCDYCAEGEALLQAQQEAEEAGEAGVDSPTYDPESDGLTFEQTCKSISVIRQRQQEEKAEEVSEPEEGEQEPPTIEPSEPARPARRIYTREDISPLLWHPSDEGLIHTSEGYQALDYINKVCEAVECRYSLWEGTRSKGHYAPAPPVIYHNMTREEAFTKLVRALNVGDRSVNWHKCAYGNIHTRELLESPAAK
ncbi:MAG: hypothetical protein J2P36_08285 [Ktedonobacteraceae bacterium]|nr:hypothetical protein [Ktedonobacteraceae bacterium]